MQRLLTAVCFCLKEMRIRRSTCLITLIVVVLISVRLSIAQDWQNYYVNGRGIPYFISASSQTAIVASEGFITCCDPIVSVDAVDLSTGVNSNLETIGPSASLFSAVEFDNGMAVSFLDRNLNLFRIRHYSFSGGITEITPAITTQLSALASDKYSLYVVDGNTGYLLKLAGVSGTWSVVASGALCAYQPRQRGVVLPDGRILWDQIVFTPPGTFSWLALPQGYMNGMRGALSVTASGNTAYILLKNDVTSSPAVWKLSSDGSTVLYDSDGLVGSFQQYNAAFVDGDNLLFGGIFSSADYTTKLLQFNLKTEQFSAFPQQGWWNASFAQISDITKTDSLLVTWDQWSYKYLAKLPSNTPPTVDTIAAPIDPVPISSSVSASASFTDPNVVDNHTALWTWGDGTSSPGTVSESNGSGSVSGIHSYTSPGVYQIVLTVTDQMGGSGQAILQYLVVYDPYAGFVTGSGWIDSPPGAYTPNPSLSGKATFGFVAKYKNGINIPTGQTQFQFHAADMNFRSTSYQWLVISGPQAKYKGEGTINGAGSFGFLLSAIDGKKNGGGGTDRFRIKIWDSATGQIVYDNQIWADDNSYPAAVIAGGSIVISE